MVFKLQSSRSLMRRDKTFFTISRGLSNSWLAGAFCFYIHYQGQLLAQFLHVTQNSNKSLKQKKSLKQRYFRVPFIHYTIPLRNRKWQQRVERAPWSWQWFGKVRVWVYVHLVMVSPVYGLLIVRYLCPIVFIIQYCAYIYVDWGDRTV